MARSDATDPNEVIRRKTEELDVQRWGDSNTQTFTPPSSVLTGTPFSLTFQLARVRWHRPIAWGVQIAIVPKQGFDENNQGSPQGTFTIEFQTTLGVGKASTQILKDYTLAQRASPLSPPVPPIFDNGFSVASAMNINAVLILNPTGTFILEPHTIEIAAYVTPVVEPYEPRNQVHTLDLVLEELRATRALLEHVHGVSVKTR